MAEVKRGSAVKKGLKFFLYGEQGTWKSSFALDFMKMKNEDEKPLRVVYIDCETGSVDNYLEDLENEGYNLDNLLLVYTTSYAEVEEWVLKAMNEEELLIKGENDELEPVIDAEGNPFVADVIVVDGITVISDNVKFAAINVSEKRAKLKAKSQEKNATEQFVAEATAGLEFKDHDKIKMKGKNLLRSLITGTDKYICVTAREKTKKVMTNVDGKMTLVEVGKIPDTWDGAEYEFFTVLRHFEDEDGSIKAQVMRKDRTKIFQQNEIIEAPTPLYWQDVINKNKDRKANILNRESIDDSIHKDEEVIAKGITKNEDKTKVDVKETTETLESLRNKIKSAIDALSPQKKKAMRPKVMKAGLELDFNHIDNIDDLKSFLALVIE
jgi:hypothetical protein